MNGHPLRPAPCPELRLTGLRAFLAVLREGSVAGAAASLGVGRSTVTRRLAALEEDLGVALTRGPWGEQTLTAAGRALAEGAPSLVAGADELALRGRRHAHGHRRRMHVVLSLGLPTTLTTLFFRVLGSLMDRPSVRLEHAARPAEVLAQRGDLAVVMGGDRPVGPWTASLVRRVPRQWMASPEYLARAGRPATLEDLAEHPLILAAIPGLPLESVTLRAGGRARIDPAIVIDDAYRARHLAADGLGIALVPNGEFEDGFLAESDTLGLEVVLGDVVQDFVESWFLFAERSRDLPAVRDYALALRQVVSVMEAAGPWREHRGA
jgi:DNA-binding transcriptional LysR family regulator